MGFDWEKYESSGGAYINAAERKVIADNGIPLTVTAIKEGEYDGDPRYELTVLAPNPESGDDEERVITFPIGSGVESRDRQLEALKAHIDSGDAEVIRIKLEKKGRSWLIRPAEGGDSGEA